MRRVVVFGLTLALTAFSGYEMARALSAGAVTWLTLAGALAFRGELRLDRRSPSSTRPSAPSSPCRRRQPATAVDPAPHRRAHGDPHAGLQRAAGALPSPPSRQWPRGLDGLGHGRAFDWFILSDTTDAAIAAAEQSAFLGLRRRLAPGSPRLLPPPAPQHPPQGRQHRRLLPALGRRLRLHAGARRRQPDGRRRPSSSSPAAWRPTPTLGILQTVPELVDARTALRPPAAVRQPRLRAAARPRARLVDPGRRQLLGPQRHHPPPRLHRAPPACRCSPARRPSAATSSATTSSRPR